MKTIGYWGATSESVKPIDHGWMLENQDTFRKILDFLNPDNVEKNGFKVTHYRGMSTCRCCNKFNGSREYEGHGLIIPQGYLHYIENHGLVPDQALIDVVNELPTYRVYPGYWEKAAGPEPFKEFIAISDEQAKEKSKGVYPAGVTFGNLLMRQSKQSEEHWFRID